MRCEEKKRYLNEQTASGAAAWIKLHRAANGPAYDPFHETLNAYVCPQCAFWHIGHDINRIHELGPLGDRERDFKKTAKKIAKKTAKKARKAAKSHGRTGPTATKVKNPGALSCYKLLKKSRILIMS